MEEANLTNEIKTCGACSADLLERDKYCRRCGARQPVTTTITTNVITVSGVLASNLIEPLSVAPTSALSEANAYQKVSRPLIEAVTVGIGAHAFSKFHNRLVRQSLSALLSIPIWLMIILLSPFDAYFAAKHISSQNALK